MPSRDNQPILTSLSHSMYVKYLSFPSYPIVEPIVSTLLIFEPNQPSLSGSEWLAEWCRRDSPRGWDIGELLADLYLQVEVSLCASAWSLRDPECELLDTSRRRASESLRCELWWCNSCRGKEGGWCELDEYWCWYVALPVFLAKLCDLYSPSNFILGQPSADLGIISLAILDQGLEGGKNINVEWRASQPHRIICTQRAPPTVTSIKHIIWRQEKRLHNTLYSLPCRRAIRVLNPVYQLFIEVWVLVPVVNVAWPNSDEWVYGITEEEAGRKNVAQQRPTKMSPMHKLAFSWHDSVSMKGENKKPLHHRIDWGKTLQRWLTILSAKAHEAWYMCIQHHALVLHWSLNLEAFLGEIKMFRQWVNPGLWNTVNAILHHRGSINTYLLIAFSFYHGSLWFHRLGTFPDNNFWERDRRRWELNRLAW